MIIDAGPFIVDGEEVNSRLWALIKRATERGEELHTTHPVLAQVWRDPVRQANLARAMRYFEVHPLDESVTIGPARPHRHLRRRRRSSRDSR